MSVFPDAESDSGSCGDEARPSCGVNVSGFLVAEYCRRRAADGYSSEEVAREHASQVVAAARIASSIFCGTIMRVLVCGAPFSLSLTSSLSHTVSLSFSALFALSLFQSMS